MWNPFYNLLFECVEATQRTRQTFKRIIPTNKIISTFCCVRKSIILVDITPPRNKTVNDAGYGQSPLDWKKAMTRFLLTSQNVTRRGGKTNKLLIIIYYAACFHILYRTCRIWVLLLMMIHYLTNYFSVPVYITNGYICDNDIVSYQFIYMHSTVNCVNINIMHHFEK